MFELVTSEASYYKSLELLETHFLRNPLLVNTLSQSDMHFLFSNIEDIMKASERCVFVGEPMWFPNANLCFCFLKEANRAKMFSNICLDHIDFSHHKV